MPSPPVEQSWLWWMFAWSVVGALAAMFWPTFISIFRQGPRGLSVYRDALVGQTADGNNALRWLRFLGVAVLIAVVVSALGFFAFIRDQQTQHDLNTLGLLSYFLAFTYGFGAGSAIEEPLKK